MPSQEILVLAMTRMLSGICTAGLTCEPESPTDLCWVRPVRDFDTVLPGDMMYDDGRLVQCCDVIELPLVEPRPDPPHVEDWLVDFNHHRPRLLRRLDGDRRASFFIRYADQAPDEILIEQIRSLGLVAPEEVWASFTLDNYSGKFQARLGFRLPGSTQHPEAAGPRGLPVTDLKWRALGRCWVAEGADDSAQTRTLCLDHEMLMERLGAEALYLTIGLSRKWKGKHWPLVHAIHVVPDYDAAIDLACL